MHNNYIFFNLRSDNIPDEGSLKNVLSEYTTEVFHPTLLHLKEHTSSILIYLFWLLFTKGKYRIIYVKKDDDIIHYTHVLPKFFKFPFMGSKDLEIGPAWTDEAYRGRGIFPAVLTYALHYFKEDKKIFYTFAYADNTSSQKAILKAGFIRWKNGYKTDKLGIYKVEKR